MILFSGRLVGIGGASPPPGRPWPAPKAENAGGQATFPPEKHPTANVRVPRATQAREGGGREIGQIVEGGEEAKSHGQDTILVLGEAEIHESA